MAGENAYLYKTTALIKVVKSLYRPQSFLLDMMFPFVDVQETEEVAFDVEIGNRKIAPFVAPTSEGKIVEFEGYHTKTFKPAYVKPKTVLTPGKSLKRAIGETIGPGSSSPAQREAANVNLILKDHSDQLHRRMEVMASEAARKSTVTVAGDSYPTTVVNFGRNGNLTVNLSGGAIWGTATADPIADVKKMAERVHKLEGANITDIIMDPYAAEAFLDNEKVQKIMDNRRQATGVVEFTGAVDLASGAKMIAQFGDYRFWSYSEFYTDEAGVTRRVLPPGTVIGTGPQVEGVRAFGAIMDSSVLRAMELFPKSWVPEDPPYRIIMSQSAPLTVLTRPNATFCLNVFGDPDLIDESDYE